MSQNAKAAFVSSQRLAQIAQPCLGVSSWLCADKPSIPGYDRVLFRSSANLTQLCWGTALPSTSTSDELIRPSTANYA
jgi:hypothetical protein